MALQKLSEWREAQSKHVCAPSSSLIAETPWRPPGNGGFKCNVDLRNGQAGYAFVCRDIVGNFMQAVAVPLFTAIEPCIVRLWASWRP